MGEEIPFWIRISYCGIALIPAFIFHFVYLYLNLLNLRKYLIVIYTYSIFVCTLILTSNLIISNMHNYPWGPYPRAGILHPYFLIMFLFIAIFAFSFLVIASRNKRIPDLKRSQIKYILIGYGIFTLSGLDFLPNYTINIRPIGFIPATIFVLTFMYAIIKHKLMEINIFFRRSIAYSLLAALISIIYLVFVIVFEKIFQKLTGYQTMFASVSSCAIISVIFYPLKNKIQNFIDKLFFHGTHEEIVHENEFLKEELLRAEKLKSIGILAGGIAHEIRNPLTAVKTFTEYLPEKLDDKEFLKNFSKIVGREVDRIDQLVHELLEFAKPSPLNLKNLDICSLVDNTVDFLNSNFLKHNIKVIRKYAPNSNFLINADLNRLRQALLNILLNAIDAMNTGGELSVGIIPHEKKITIIVEDTGIGILPKDLKHIFDPFYTKKDHGTGLGLSITQRIIEDHNGRILVESTPGKGTKFIIELPTKSSI